MNDVTYLKSCVTYSNIDLPNFVIDSSIRLNRMKSMGNSELEKSKPHIIVEIIEYISNTVVNKTIIKRATGNITISSLDAGEELSQKKLPYDIYIQIIDGSAELIINDKKIKLKLGEGIIIPAHSKYCFNANVKFKMISTIIKSGYED